jgi:hypothetical protein
LKKKRVEKKEEGKCATGRGENFGGAKVRQLHVAVRHDQHVFGLQIAVKHVLPMHILHRVQQFHGEKTRQIDGQAPEFLYPIVHFAFAGQLEDKVQGRAVLKRMVELDNVGVLEHGEALLFHHDVLLLVVSRDEALVETF